MTDEIILIAAVADNGIIGADGKIPWHIREDFLHFKKLTWGHTIIMGRRTWESLPRKPLPGRTNIIVSATIKPQGEGVFTAPSLAKAIGLAKNTHPQNKIFLIGGYRIYEEGLVLADSLELTRVHQRPEGDTHFPEWNTDTWQLADAEAHTGYTFERWTLKNKRS